MSCLGKLLALTATVCVANLSANSFLSSRSVVTSMVLQEAQNLDFNSDSPE